MLTELLLGSYGLDCETSVWAKCLGGEKSSRHLIHMFCMYGYKDGALSSVRSPEGLFNHDLQFNMSKTRNPESPVFPLILLL